MSMIRPWSRTGVAAVAGVAVLAAGGAAVAVVELHRGAAHGVRAAGNSGPSPTVSVEGVRHGHVRWDRHVQLDAVGGTLRSVQVVDAQGTPLTGRVSSDGRTWRSDGTLVPTARYTGAVVLAGSGGDIRRTVRFRATDAAKHLGAVISPGDGDVVGVGSPVIVDLSRPVTKAQRALVESRLAVATTPDVVGAWHWMSDQELHWRPPTYWAPHSTVTVTADLTGLDLGAGLWGSGDHQATFRIGASHISRVDVARHQMYVYDNGKLIRTMPISAGRDKYPTKNGVHITFEKSQVVTMDSRTVGIPLNSPDGYYEKVYWDVRISYGGAFVHAAPWSVADQGVINVSHGCVNLSVANAEWFYYWAQRGDIVDVYNSAAAPDLADPGMADWNMTWKQWVAGDAAPTAAALDAREPLPRSVEPPAPKAPLPPTPPPYYPPPPPTPSHSPSHSPSPKPTRSAAPTPRPSHPHSATPSPSPSRRHHH